MQSYGQSMNGSFIAEKVIKLPTWSPSDTGRFLYDTKTENYYLGAPDSSIAQEGWIPIGITSSIIRSYNIDWDVEISNRLGAVSAKDLPVSYQNKPSDMQTVIDDIEDILRKVREGTYIADHAIKRNHLLTEGKNAINATVIPILNASSLFPEISGSIISIEEALHTLITRTAEKIGLEDSPRVDIFGSKLDFKNVKTIQDGLEALEGYLDTLTAADIPCTYEGCSCETNVQFVLDALYKMYTEIKFTDLLDTPASYDSNHIYLKANGNSIEWGDIIANEVIVQYPGTTQSNLQYALWTMEGDINNLVDKITKMKISAADINYTPATSKYVVTNVASALDTILTSFYSPINKPDATDISCVAMGGPANTNVQLVLAYLNSQLNTVLSTLPCSVGAEDVSYASANGATNVAETLTYILSFLDYLRTNHGVQYAGFVPKP